MINIKSYTTMSSLRNAIRTQMYNAANNALNQSFQDAHDNVDNFYNSSEGRYYHRTGQLAESVMHQEISGAGDHYVGEISLDTWFRYNPSGRDTQTIYNYAESGELLGNGGFWSKTLQDIEKNINREFGKRFRK